MEVIARIYTSMGIACMKYECSFCHRELTPVHVYEILIDGQTEVRDEMVTNDVVNALKCIKCDTLHHLIES